MKFKSEKLRVPGAWIGFSLLALTYSSNGVAQVTFTLITADEYQQSQSKGDSPPTAETKAFEVT